MTKITTQQMTIVIDKKEYIELLISQERLRRLDGGGVDNWEWYGESLNPDGEQDMDEFKVQTTKTINERS